MRFMRCLRVVVTAVVLLPLFSPTFLSHNSPSWGIYWYKKKGAKCCFDLTSVFSLNFFLSKSRARVSFEKHRRLRWKRFRNWTKLWPYSYTKSKASEYEWKTSVFGYPKPFFLLLPMKRTIERHDLNSVWLEPAPEVEVSPRVSIARENSQ